MPNPPSAAQSLYPHLPTSARPEVKQSKPNLAEAMYPGPKPPPGWHREDLSLIKREFGQGGSDIEIARRYGITKQVVGQIRKLGGR
jgi:hypothetical protein